ncbi:MULTISPECIES: hypothetical protein [unclassified Acinetobacter]|uniref:hypothetical protein n=1 Tax=unclassified Acinetobacter TaxID=196816 RepID=UPI0025BC8E23|nr:MULTISPECIES: hypothetical protein [unclassified Acinetobacter]
MDATRFPSLALCFKAVLKTGSGCRVWEKKRFLSTFDLSKVESCLRKGIKIKSSK